MVVAVTKVIVNVGRSSGKLPLTFRSGLSTLKFSRQILVKTTIIKYNKEFLIGRQVASCGGTKRRADLTKLIAINNFA
jgi:hypothetical protein